MMRSAKPTAADRAHVQDVLPSMPDQRAAGSENFEAVLSSKPDTVTATNAARDWMRGEYQAGRSTPNLAVQRLAAQYGYDASFVDGLPILFQKVPKKAAPMRNKSRPGSR